MEVGWRPQSCPLSLRLQPLLLLFLLWRLVGKGLPYPRQCTRRVVSLLKNLLKQGRGSGNQVRWRWSGVDDGPSPWSHIWAPGSWMTGDRSRGWDEQPSITRLCGWISRPWVFLWGLARWQDQSSEWQSTYLQSRQTQKYCQKIAHLKGKINYKYKWKDWTKITLVKKRGIVRIINLDLKYPT